MVGLGVLVYGAAMPSPPESRDVPADGVLGGRTTFDAQLARLADRGRTERAAQQRSREHWLRRQADEEATFAGVLTDLAERGDLVAVATATGRRHRGWLVAVGADFCVVRTEDRQQVVVHHRAVASVRPEPGRPLATGDREITTTRTLADHLAALADDRPRVLVTTTGPGDSAGGVLRSVGRDVLVVALDGDRRGLAYVPVASVAEVSLPVSG